MNRPIIRWWVSFIVSLLVLLTVLLMGLGGFILESDKTYLSWVIFAVYIVGSLHLGYKLYHHSEDHEVTKQFMSLCTDLGLLGTVIGLIISLSNFVHIDIQNIESVKSTLTSIAAGTGAALVTTLVGLITYLLLQWQLVISHEKWGKDE